MLCVAPLKLINGLLGGEHEGGHGGGRRGLSHLVGKQEGEMGPTERGCRSTTGPGSLSLRRTLGLARSQPCGGNNGRYKGSRGSQDWPQN